MHMSRTVIQVPIDSAIRDKCHKIAKEQGFSSLQEMLRLVLKKFANGEIAIGIYKLEKGQKEPVITI